MLLPLRALRRPTRSLAASSGPMEKKDRVDVVWGPNNTALVMYEESSKAGQPLPKERFQTLRGAAAVAERAPSGALRMKLRRTCGVRGCEARRGSCLLMTTAFPRCSRGRA